MPPEEELFDEFPPLELQSSNVFVHLEKVYNSETCSDVTFILKDGGLTHKIYCHKIILSLRSNYFNNLFLHKNKGI